MKLYKNTINTSLYLSSKMIRKIGYVFIHLANIISERTIKYPVLEENDKSITICIDGIKYNLVKGNYIDEEIIKNGVFEKNICSGTRGNNCLTFWDYQDKTYSKKNEDKQDRKQVFFIM